MNSSIADFVLTRCTPDAAASTRVIDLLDEFQEWNDSFVDVFKIDEAIARRYPIVEAVTRGPKTQVRTYNGVKVADNDFYSGLRLT
jgi:hypothetical protein